MRRLQKILWIVAAGLLSQAAMADESLQNTNNPLGKLQAQLDLLTARTEALENGVPSSDVNGRTYCSMLEISIMRGRSFNATEELQTNIVRRTVNFSGGAFNGAYLSNVLNNQTDDGVVEHTPGTIIDPLLASYVQTGSKLDIAFAEGRTATWYVSSDGSLIYGTKIEHSTFAGGAVTVGFVRKWTLVETNPLDTCDAEHP